MTVLTQRQSEPTGEGHLILNDSVLQGGGPDNSGDITRGGVNPAAAAMLVLYQVMYMYAQITGIFSQQQQTQISAEQSSGEADSKALIAGGKAIQASMKTAAICAYVGAGFGMFMTVVGAIAQYKQGSSARALEETNKPMTTTAHMDELTEIEPAVSGAEPSPEVRQTANSLRQGRYQSLKQREGESKEDYENRLQEGVKQLHRDEEYEDFKLRLDQKSDTLQRQLANKTQAGSTYFQVSSTVGQSGQGITSGYSQQAQGEGQAKQAQENAASALNKSSLAMAQTAASSIAQKQNEAAQNIGSGQRTLQAIAESSARVS
jgi:hypothetical protein